MQPELLFGIQTNGIKHTHADPMPDIDTRFRMAKEAGVFDYVDKTPAPDEIDAFIAARDKYGLPVRGSGWFYTLGRDESLLDHNLELAQRLGSLVHNVQVLVRHADGHLVSNQEVADFYQHAFETGERYGVKPCFEVHVNMWSEDFRRVAEVAALVESRGLPFRMTLDHSHVIFKIDHEEEQAVMDIRDAVRSGELVLDPFRDGSVCRQWIDSGWIHHCHARSAVPCNPRNVEATDPEGKHGRGIQYPFKQPGPGEYHAAWDERRLEPWKEVVRQLLAYHARDPDAHLGQISTEFIPNFDYGEGCRYSLFEQAIACVEWMRAEWSRIVTQAP
ncbi:MAG: hypothetical protein AAF458_10450 [Pseudomonadota bacterium]